MKVFFRRIHLWLGLATGLVLMITCLTGAILVFETELQQLFFPKRYFVEQHEGLRKPVDEWISTIKTEVPGAEIGTVKIYNDPDRTAEISITVPGKNKSDKSTRLTVFVNPYTGAIIEKYNYRESFFYFTMDAHRWMLSGKTGKFIVGTCSLIFIFILITGIILWWPKNKAILKQRLKIKRNASFKRLNHDYHVVLGFYSALFLLIFTFTGLSWSFEWFNKAIYTVTNSSMERPKVPKNERPTNEHITAEHALQNVMDQAKNAQYYRISLPKDSASVYSVNVLMEDAAHETASDNYHVDAVSGKIAATHLFTDKNLGQRVRSTFKPVHLASIYGWPSKIIGFLACLLGTFFPASGIIMWANRVRKKKK